MYQRIYPYLLVRRIAYDKLVILSLHPNDNKRLMKLSEQIKHIKYTHIETNKNI